MAKIGPTSNGHTHIYMTNQDQCIITQASSMQPCVYQVSNNNVKAFSITLTNYIHSNANNKLTSVTIKSMTGL